MAHKKYTGYFVFCEAERHAVKQELQHKLDREEAMAGGGQTLGLRLLCMSSENDGVRYPA